MQLTLKDAVAVELAIGSEHPQTWKDYGSASDLSFDAIDRLTVTQRWMIGDRSINQWINLFFVSALEVDRRCCDR